MRSHPTLWVLAVLGLPTATAGAQTYATDRGVWQPGGTVGLVHSRNSGADGSATTFTLGPRLGYFVLPGLAVTANASVGYASRAQGHDVAWGAGPGLAYYFGRGARRLYPYLAGLALFTWNRSSNRGVIGPALEVNVRRWQVSGGGVVLVARNVALSRGLYYAHNTQTVSGSSTADLALGFSEYGTQFGVSVFAFERRRHGRNQYGHGRPRRRGRRGASSSIATRALRGGRSRPGRHTPPRYGPRAPEGPPTGATASPSRRPCRTCLRWSP